MIYDKTRRVLDHLEKLGAATLNTSSFPIVEVPLADADDLDRVGALLFERGIYATLAFYPGVPRHEVGFRLRLTAANTSEQVDQLLVVLDELADPRGATDGYRRPRRRLNRNSTSSTMMMINSRVPSRILPPFGSRAGLPFRNTG